MAVRFLLSLTALSLIFSAAYADSDKKGDKQSSVKKQKAHYAGSRRPQPKVKAQGEKKKSSHIKNKWFKSKTHPKAEKEEVVQHVDNDIEPPEELPYYSRDPLDAPETLLVSGRDLLSASPQTSLPRTQAPQPQEQEGHEYPHGGFQAPHGHVYVVGEWLYWRTRQEGMEFAPAKTINFEFESGFRVGLGVHMPHDVWDIYISYTNFRPDHSANAEGFFYPLFLFDAAAVTHGHAQWSIDFQSGDVEVGRAYSISKTLVLRPFFGIRGAWIDQHAHIHYNGGVVPAGQTFETHFKNDFRGAGPLLGIESNWELDYGFSLFGDAAGALVVGHFNNRQHQRQLNGFEPINLNTRHYLVSPNAQMIAGVAWDRNFNRDRCHFGLSAGFETQFWWSQNQTEQFTDVDQPIYVRQRGNLAFFGLTLGGRFDF